MKTTTASSETVTPFLNYSIQYFKVEYLHFKRILKKLKFSKFELIQTKGKLNYSEQGASCDLEMTFKYGLMYMRVKTQVWRNIYFHFHLAYTWK